MSYLFNQSYTGSSFHRLQYNDGSGRYIDPPVSICLWFKRLDTTNRGYRHGIGGWVDNGSAQTDCYGIWCGSSSSVDNDAICATDGYNGSYREAAGTAINDTNWHGVVATFNASSATSITERKIYIDSSTAAATESSTATMNPSLQYLLLGAGVTDAQDGGAASDAKLFFGYIAEVSIWNKVLTPTEIAELLGTGNNTTNKKASDVSFYADCFSYYPLNGDYNDAKSTRHLTANSTAPASDSEHPTFASGASVAIDSVSDATYTNGQTGITITGSGFGASQGAGVVLISPTNVDDASAVEQTVTSWASDTSVTFTAVRGSLAYNTTMYLFVKEDGGTSNAAGEPVSFYDPAAGLVILPRRTTFVNDIIIQY